MIEITNVYKTYDTGNKALRNINISIEDGEFVFIVGRSGSGKSTLLKLLLKEVEPTSGKIVVNDMNLGKMPRRYVPKYRRRLGVVFQDFRLFAFPVWKNITAGGERLEERIRKALRQADAEGLVQAMPQGLDTNLYKNLGDGVEISGGEAQKLALARALYKDAPVVILDEPTAALDPEAEAEVYARFNRMVEGRTSIYISHRMSSCRFCEDIIVFDQGRIVERGSHEELCAAGGNYARMWEAQAKYYT